MTPERHALAKAIFLELLDCPPEQMPARLSSHCGEDADLRQQVQRLLEHFQDQTLRVADVVSPSLLECALLGDDAATAAPEPALDAILTAGTIIAGRYRVVALLGEGGMGRVYRVEDLTLKQTVALKFMQSQMSGNPAWLTRFYREARLARTITHPNVCRVFDVGTSEGLPFLSMEYVDGEDLAALLRRVGHVPGERAAEIAFELCIGLEAAHARGVLHRDLKPSNVMIDGQGRVRITDFGLAGLQEHISGQHIREGTPAYMAPEQLSGQAVTIRSDLYCLGLVLYELFTGHRAVQASTPAEYSERHLTSRPALPSRFVGDVDPGVEQAIMQCLEKDATRRPDSALAVAVALPGHDPLAAALAAQRTPSPETVAAGEAHTGSWFAPLPRLLTCAALLALMLTLRGAVQMPWDRPGKHPEALAEDARELLRVLDHAPQDGAGRSASGYCNADEMFDLAPGYPVALKDHVLDQGHVASSDDELIFWYRESGDLLLPKDFRNVAFGYGNVTPRDPPVEVPGMVSMALDLQGRLRLFSVVPQPQPAGPRDSTQRGADPWPALFAAAGLEPGDLAEAQPLASTWFRADRAAAWNGMHRGRPARVDALALDDRAVFFAVSPMETPNEAPSGWMSALTRHFVSIDQATRKENGDLFLTLLLIVLTFVAIPWAWRNLALGRGDRTGALRLAATFFALQLVMRLLQTRYAPTLEIVYYVALATLDALAAATLAWLYYMALEPNARDRWPHMLITWSRILRGRPADPAVGQHVLAGVICGLALSMLPPLEHLLLEGLGWASRPPLIQDETFVNLLGRFAAAGVLDAVSDALVRSLAFVLLLAVLRAALRLPWAAVLVGTLVVGLLSLTRAEHPFTGVLLLGLLGAGSWSWIAVNYGLVSLVTATIVVRTTSTFPLGFGTWFEDLTMLALAVVAGLTVLGYVAAIRKPAAA